MEGVRRLDRASEETGTLHMDGPVVLAAMIDMQVSKHQIPVKIGQTGRKISRVYKKHVVSNVVPISLSYIACAVVVNTTT